MEQPAASIEGDERLSWGSLKAQVDKLERLLDERSSFADLLADYLRRTDCLVQHYLRSDALTEERGRRELMAELEGLDSAVRRIEGLLKESEGEGQARAAWAVVREAAASAECLQEQLDAKNRELAACRRQNRSLAQELAMLEEGVCGDRGKAGDGAAGREAELSSARRRVRSLEQELQTTRAAEAQQRAAATEANKALADERARAERLSLEKDTVHQEGERMREEIHTAASLRRKLEEQLLALSQECLRRSSTKDAAPDPGKEQPADELQRLLRPGADRGVLSSEHDSLRHVFGSILADRDTEAAKAEAASLRASAAEDEVLRMEERLVLLNSEIESARRKADEAEADAFDAFARHEAVVGELRNAQESLSSVLDSRASLMKELKAFEDETDFAFNLIAETASASAKQLQERVRSAKKAAAAFHARKHFLRFGCGSDADTATKELVRCLHELSAASGAAQDGYGEAAGFQHEQLPREVAATLSEVADAKCAAAQLSAVLAELCADCVAGDPAAHRGPAESSPSAAQHSPATTVAMTPAPSAGPSPPPAAATATEALRGLQRKVKASLPPRSNQDPDALNRLRAASRSKCTSVEALCDCAIDALADLAAALAEDRRCDLRSGDALADQRVVALNEEVDRLKEVLKETTEGLDRDVAEYSSELRKVQGEREAAERVSEQLSLQLKEKERECLELGEGASKLLEARDANERLSGELAACQRERDELRKGRSEAERLSAELRESRGEAERLSAELRESRGEAERLFGELEAICRERDELRGERGMAERLSSELRESRGEAKRLSSELASCCQERDELRKERAIAERLSGELKESRAAAERLSDELVACCNQRDELREDAEFAKEAAKEACNEADRLASELQGRSCEASRLRSELQAAHRREDELRQSLCALGSDADAALEALQAARAHYCSNDTEAEGRVRESAEDGRPLGPAARANQGPDPEAGTGDCAGAMASMREVLAMAVKENAASKSELLRLRQEVALLKDERAAIETLAAEADLPGDADCSAAGDLAERLNARLERLQALLIRSAAEQRDLRDQAEQARAAGRGLLRGIDLLLAAAAAGGPPRGRPSSSGSTGPPEDPAERDPESSKPTRPSAWQRWAHPSSAGDLGSSGGSGSASTVRAESPPTAAPPTAFAPRDSVAGNGSAHSSEPAPGIEEAAADVRRNLSLMMSTLGGAGAAQAAPDHLGDDRPSGGGGHHRREPLPEPGHPDTALAAQGQAAAPVGHGQASSPQAPRGARRSIEVCIQRLQDLLDSPGAGNDVELARMARAAVLPWLPGGQSQAQERPRSGSEAVPQVEGGPKGDAARPLGIEEGRGAITDGRQSPRAEGALPLTSGAEDAWRGGVGASIESDGSELARWRQASSVRDGSQSPQAGQSAPAVGAQAAAAGAPQRLSDSQGPPRDPPPGDGCVGELCSRSNSMTIRTSIEHNVAQLQELLASPRLSEKSEPATEGKDELSLPQPSPSEPRTEGCFAEALRQTEGSMRPRSNSSSSTSLVDAGQGRPEDTPLSWHGGVPVQTLIEESIARLQELLSSPRSMDESELARAFEEILSSPRRVPSEAGPRRRSIAVDTCTSPAKSVGWADGGGGGGSPHSPRRPRGPSATPLSGPQEQEGSPFGRGGVPFPAPHLRIPPEGAERDEEDAAGSEDRGPGQEGSRHSREGSLADGSTQTSSPLSRIAGVPVHEQIEDNIARLQDLLASPRCGDEGELARAYEEILASPRRAPPKDFAGGEQDPPPGAQSPPPAGSEAEAIDARMRGGALGESWGTHARDRYGARRLPAEGPSSLSSSGEDVLCRSGAIGDSIESDASELARWRRASFLRHSGQQGAQAQAEGAEPPRDDDARSVRFWGEGLSTRDSIESSIAQLQDLLASPRYEDESDLAKAYEDLLATPRGASGPPSLRCSVEHTELWPAEGERRGGGADPSSRGPETGAEAHEAEDGSCDAGFDDSPAAPGRRSVVSQSAPRRAEGTAGAGSDWRRRSLSMGRRGSSGTLPPVAEAEAEGQDGGPACGSAHAGEGSAEGPHEGLQAARRSAAAWEERASAPSGELALVGEKRALEADLEAAGSRAAALERRLRAAEGELGAARRAAAAWEDEARRLREGAQGGGAEGLSARLEEAEAQMAELRGEADGLRRAASAVVAAAAACGLLGARPSDKAGNGERGLRDVQAALEGLGSVPELKRAAEELGLLKAQTAELSVGARVALQLEGRVDELSDLLHDSEMREEKLREQLSSISLELENARIAADSERSAREEAESTVETMQRVFDEVQDLQTSLSSALMGADLREERVAELQRQLEDAMEALHLAQGREAQSVGWSSDNLYRPEHERNHRYTERQQPGRGTALLSIDSEPRHEPSFRENSNSTRVSEKLKRQFVRRPLNLESVYRENSQFLGSASHSGQMLGSTTRARYLPEHVACLDPSFQCRDREQMLVERSSFSSPPSNRGGTPPRQTRSHSTSPSLRSCPGVYDRTESPAPVHDRPAWIP